MAFVSALPDNLDDIDLQVLTSEREVLGRVCIGIDDETGRIYSLVVSLVTPMGHRSSDRRELMFGVTEVLPEADPFEGDWLNDGLQTSRFLARMDRARVLDCLCAVSAYLVKLVQPDVIVMMTVSDSLPAKALTKYRHVCHALCQAGYQGGEADPYHGARIWMFEKIET